MKPVSHILSSFTISLLISFLSLSRERIIVFIDDRFSIFFIVSILLRYLCFNSYFYFTYIGFSFVLETWEV